MVNLECKFKHGNYILVCLTYLGNSVRRFFLALLPATALMPRLAAAGLGKNSPAGEKFSYEICRKIKFGKIRLPVKNFPTKFAGK